MTYLKHKKHKILSLVLIALPLLALLSLSNIFTATTLAVTCTSSQVPVKDSSGNVTSCVSCADNDTPVDGECPIVQTTQSPATYACGSQTSGGTEGQPTEIDFGCKGNICNPNNPGYDPGNSYCTSYHNPLIDLLFSIIQFLSDGVGIVVIASLIVGGIQFTLARDNPEAAARARGRIATSLFALLLFIFAYAILNYIVPAGFFGQ